MRTYLESLGDVDGAQGGGIDDGGVDIGDLRDGDLLVRPGGARRTGRDGVWPYPASALGVVLCCGLIVPSALVVNQMLGQERSRIAGMLAAEPESSRAVELDVAARVQAWEIFTLLDPSVSGNFLTDIAASAAARSVAEIEQAVLGGDAALLATVEVERWFAQATAVSGEYHALLEMRTAAVQVRADRLVSDARSELRWEVAATAFMLVGALIFGLGLLAFARYRISNGAHRFARQSQFDAARIEAILSTASDAIITMDENAFIQACNPAVESVYGYLPAELVGQRLSILMPDDATARSDGRLDEYLRVSGENLIGTRWESVCRRKDGSEAPVEVMSTRVVIGGRTMITSIARDISERKRALENLVRRDLEVSR